MHKADYFRVIAIFIFLILILDVIVILNINGFKPSITSKSIETANPDNNIQVKSLDNQTGNITSIRVVDANLSIG
ncbi:MAG: hypothetical protein WC979_07310 [Candidatus Pacearchaeota archaeon]|jgi:hypothetical protein